MIYRKKPDVNVALALGVWQVCLPKLGMSRYYNACVATRPFGPSSGSYTGVVLSGHPRVLVGRHAKPPSYARRTHRVNPLH